MAFKFSAQFVDGFDDAQLNFEQLQDSLNVPGSQLPFLQLLSAQKLQIASGNTTLTWTASVSSNTVTVTHGIGRTPICALATMNNNLTAGVVPAVMAFNLTSTTLQLFGWNSASGTGNLAVSWLAIG